MLKKLNQTIVGTTLKYKFSTSFDANKDYYKILGLSKTANDAQIKSAYYKLAMKYHPDHNKGQQAKFKEINQAYTVLSDSKSKKQYQSYRASGSTYNNTQNPYQNTYQNYNRNQYQNPYNQSQNPYNQYQHPYNQYNQWNYQQHNNAHQWSNRQYYENPYEAYDKFRQQYEQADRQRMRRRQQQYQQYMKEQDKFHEEIADNFKKTARLAIIISLFLFLFVIGRNGNRARYVDPNSAEYHIVSMNNYPYLQRDQGYGAQYQPQPRNYY